MPYGSPEPEDPHMLVGMSVPGDETSIREMASAMAEEYASMGYDENSLMAVFRQPFYAGAHLAWRILGEETILRLVREAVNFRAQVRQSIEEAQAGRASGNAEHERESRSHRRPPEEETPCRK